MWLGVLFIPFSILQDEIIPEDFRSKVDEEEKQKEMADLYLPPRKRKTVNQTGQKVGRRERSCLCLIILFLVLSLLFRKEDIYNKLVNKFFPCLILFFDSLL